jgi:hypothetical protein
MYVVPTIQLKKENIEFILNAYMIEPVDFQRLLPKRFRDLGSWLCLSL